MAIAVHSCHICLWTRACHAGVIAQGSCGFTNSDGSLVYPRDVYAAAADANEDYPGG